MEVGRLETLGMGRVSLLGRLPASGCLSGPGFCLWRRCPAVGYSVQCAVCRLLSRGLRRRPGRWLAAAAQQDGESRGSHSRRETVAVDF